MANKDATIPNLSSPPLILVFYDKLSRPAAPRLFAELGLEAGQLRHALGLACAVAALFKVDDQHATTAGTACVCVCVSVTFAVAGTIAYKKFVSVAVTMQQAYAVEASEGLFARQQVLRPGGPAALDVLEEHADDAALLVDVAE